MKIVVIGGSGLIGSKLVTKLSKRDHEAVAASLNTGVNTLTGEGLTEVLKDASVVVDVSNSPSFEEKAVMEFFTTSTRNLLTYEAKAGVQHHVALSVVGTDRLQESPYIRAKVAQEKLIKESEMPYSLFTQRNSSNLGGASLIKRTWATKFACHRCSYNPSRRKMWPKLWVGSRQAIERRGGSSGTRTNAVAQFTCGLCVLAMICAKWSVDSNAR